MNSIAKKIRVPDLALMKQRGERIAMLTAYDATMARLFDQAGIDLLLVGCTILQAASPYASEVREGAYSGSAIVRRDRTSAEAAHFTSTIPD